MQPTQKLAASNNIYICAVNWPKMVHTKNCGGKHNEDQKLLVMIPTVVMLPSALTVPASAASDPYPFEALIYGSKTVDENLGLASYWQISGRRFSRNNSGIVRGFWNVDSAGNYPHYN